MHTQAQKNFSAEWSPFLLSEDRGLKEEQPCREGFSNDRANGAVVANLQSAEGIRQVHPIRAELQTPRSATEGSSGGATIFPYIPRKRQERSGLLIDYLYWPALDAAGDQVDFLILGENRVGVLLADVSGKTGHKNLPITKTALRSNSAGLSTAATLRYLDQHLSEICTNGFAGTAVYAIFDQNKRLLHFASAGHLPMLIHRLTLGKIFLLNTSGSPFGSIANEAREPNGTLAIGMNTVKSERVALRQNDLLVLYSDGLLAARNANGEYFGRQRLVDFVRAQGDLSPTAFLVELKRVLEKFTGSHLVTDDITVIVIKNVLRDLDKPRNEVEDLELEKRFLTTDEEQAILEVLRANPGAGAAEVLERLAGGQFGYLNLEQVQTYLTQLGHWLQPWQDRNGKTESKLAQNLDTANQNGSTASYTRKQFHQDILAAFPIRPLLHSRFNIRGGSPEMVQAFDHYNHGDHERAFAEFTRLRPNIKNSASVHCLFGNLYLLLNEPLKAQHEFVMALKLDPRCVHAILALSYIALLQEDYQTAIDSIATAQRFSNSITIYQKFAEKLIAAVERLENRNEWIV
jgi:tetratricopeptide (TPR) repeat protein